MVSLNRRYSFRPWAPDLGNNRELPEGERMLFEVAVGLTKEQLRLLSEDMSAAAKKGSDDDVRRAFAAALSPYVRVKDGPHSIDGAQLETLEDFIGIMQKSNDAGVLALTELGAAVGRFNSLSGPDELFSLRRSGGWAGTRARSVVKDERETAAPSNGKPTSGTEPSASTPTAPPVAGP